MNDSFDEIKRELYALFERMRHMNIPSSPCGLTQAESRVVFAIYELRSRYERIRPGLVAEIMHTKPSALSQTLKALEEKGLIERSRAGGDYRAVSVSLTDEGERCADEAKQLRNEHMDQVLQCIGEEDMRHLVRILEKVVNFHDQVKHKTQAEGSATPVNKEGGTSSCV